IAVLAALLGDLRPALLAVWLALLASPALARELLTGGDLVSNSISVLVGMLGVVCLRSVPLKVAAAAFLGVALSSRANLVLVAPLVLGAVAYRDGGRVAGATALAIGGAFLAITAPFYLHDRAGFSPLDTSSKITVVGQLVEHGRVVFLGAAAASAFALAAIRPDARGARLLASAAAVQAFTIGTVVIADSVRAGRLDFFFLVSGYGLIVLFLGMTAAWLALAPAPRPCHAVPRRG